MASTPSPQYVTKRIDQIREGDVVMARDEHGTELGLKRVVEVYEHESDHLRILQFSSPDGTTQMLKTTNEHPFWDVNRAAYVAPAELEVGAEVTGPHGERASLVSSEYEPHPEGVKVYNFQVEDYHTYFVNGSGADAAPILVHNACGLEWVNENAHMSRRARAYNNSVPGNRVGQAPALRYDNPFGGRNIVRFDGLDNNVLIDRKLSVYGSKKAKLQARRQEAALLQNGMRGQWEVPTEAAAKRADSFLRRLRIDVIDVVVVPE